MINCVVLTGRLTKSPELKYTTNNVAFLRFTIAVNRSFTNQNGQREADFINCIAWRKTAENMAKFLQKGSLIGVQGKIQTSNFEGKDGNRVFMTEVNADDVQFLESNKNNQNQEGTQQPQNQSQGAYQENDYSQQPSYKQDNSAHRQSYQSQPEPAYSGVSSGQQYPSDDDLPF